MTHQYGCTVWVEKHLNFAFALKGWTCSLKSNSGNQDGTFPNGIALVQSREYINITLEEIKKSSRDEENIQTKRQKTN